MSSILLRRIRPLLRLLVALGMALSLLMVTFLLPQTQGEASAFPAAPLLTAPFTLSNPSESAVAAPLFAPSISATKRDTLQVDVNSDGVANPGDTIRYTIGITNAGPDPATGVNFNDTIDANTTLVAGSVNVSPLARDDTYTTVGNTLLVVGGSPPGFPAVTATGSVLDNDSEFFGDTFSLLSYDTASANGGTVVMNATGVFSYNPPVGFTGTDTFNYTISDGSLTGAGRVIITVTDVVWYVRNNAAAGGTGRSNSPFNTLAAAQTASSANHYIYVHTGDGTSTNQGAGIVLKSGQRLIGQGVALIVNGFTLATAGTRPLIEGGAGTGVALASNNTVRGLNIGNSTPGINGTNFGTLTLDTVSINTNNAALLLNTGTANATFTNVTASGGGVNVNLTGVAGTVDLGTGALSGATSYNLLMNQGTATVSYGGTITAGNVTRPVEITNKTGGSVTLSGLISTAAAATSNGIFLNNNTGGGTYTFTGGVQLNTGVNPAFTATSTGNIEVTGTTNTLSTTSGQAINIANTNRTSNGITFRSVSVNGATTGVLLNTVGGTGSFAITGTGTTNASGGTIQNVSTRGVSIISTNNVALSNISLTNTPISDGPAATCGDLETGQPGNSGCNAAIHLDTVTGATLTNTDISGGSQQGVNGSSVTNFSLTGSNLNNMGDGIDEHGVNLRNVFGTSSISSNTINDGFEGNIYVHNLAASAGTLTVSNNSLTNSALGAGGFFSTGASGNLTVSATSNTIQNNFNAGLQMTMDGANASFTATNNTVLNGGSPAISVGGTAGTGTYNISDNTATNPDFVSFGAGASGNIILSGRIDNNTTDGPEETAANSIVVTSVGTANHTSLIEDNDITNYDATSTAMFILANQGSSVGNFTVRNNVINGTNNAGATNAILVRYGSIAGDTNQGCVAVYGNDVNNWNAALPQIRVHLRFNTNVQHFRNGQTGTDPAILNANNPLASNNAYDVTAPAVSTQTNTPCTIPALALVPLVDARPMPITGWTDEKEYIVRPVAPVVAEEPVAEAVVTKDAPATTDTATESTQEDSFAGETISFAVGDLPSNKRLIVVFNAIISNPLAAGVNNISNQGTVSGSNFANVVTNDPDTGAANDATLTPVTAQPDYGINKSDSIASVVPGGVVTYTLAYSNTGNQGGSGVTLNETVPANTTFNPGASSAGWVCAPNNNAGSTCTNPIGTLNGGGVTGSRIFAVTVVNPVPAGVTQISNTASISDNGTNGSDPTPANNTDTETTPVTAQPDITISKSDGGTSTTPGGTVTYALAIANVGNQGATGIVATEIVPANTTFNAGASSAGWVCAPNNNAGSSCTIAIGTVNGGGASVTRNFAVTVVNPLPATITQISNTASAADDGTNGTDPDTSNNSSSDTTPVTAQPDISVSKTDGGTSTTPGGTVTYAVTVANIGNQNATGVVLTETVPANTTFNTAGSTAGWSCANGSPAGTTCLQTIGALNGGSATTLRNFAVTVVNPVAAGVSQISNSALARDDGTNGTDPNTGNNTGTDTTPLTAQPDYTITKTDGGATTTPGGTVVYTLAYSNTGNQGGTGVTLNETVPANTTFNAGGSSAGWVCTPNNNAGSACTNTIGAMNAGTNGTRNFAVSVVNPVPAGVVQISNTATISDDVANGTDPTPAGNTASDTTPVTAAPDLTVSKDDGNVTGIPGSTVVYTLTYSNVGNQGATGVVLTETVPPNTTFNSGSSSAGWSCANGSPAGTTCTNTIGAVNAGTGGTRLFAVTVNAVLPGGTTSTTNTVSIADDGANGADPTPGNNTDSEVTPVFAAPDLSLTKSDGGATLAPGGTVIYTLSYSNIGTIGATGAVISETVPANTTFNTASSSAGWSCANGSAAGTTCTNTVGAIAVGGTGTRNFAVTVISPVAAGVAQISNTATISEDGTNGTDPDTANNRGTDTTPVTAQPDISLSKTDGGISTTPGSTVAYTLTVSNVGNQGGTGTVITETVPANTTFNTASSSAGWSCANGSPAGTTCLNTVGALNGGGASATRRFAVTVINPVPAGVTQLTNNATSGNDNTNGTDPNTANNAASDTTPLTAQPDFGLSKTDGGISTAPGNTLPYSLTVTNGGNQGATGVVLTETVPANTTFNAGASTAGWVCAPNNNAGSTCTLAVGGINGGGASATRIFALTVSNPVPAGVTQISNTASTGDNGANGADPTPGNNSASDTTPLNATPDISISKTDGGASTTPGSTVIYTLTVSNIGTQGAAGVVVSETVPPNTTFNTTGSSSGWSCANGSPAGTTCTNTVGSLNGGGASATRTFAVTVVTPIPAGVSQISNTATAADDGANGTDPNSANNSATDTTPVTAQPDISLSKTDGGISTTPGSAVAYTLTVSNVGNQGATGTVITETVPANSTFNSASSSAGWSCANGSPAGTTCVNTVGSLNGGSASATRRFAVTVANPVPAGTTQLSNTATSGNDNTNGTDPNTGNNSASDTTPITAQPDLALNKDDGGLVATLGTVIPYSLTVTNNGNEGATGVVLTEAVPADTTFNTAGSSSGWSCANGSPAGTTCTLAVGSVNGGGASTVRVFAVQVNMVVAPTVTQISNSASVADNGANGTDPNPGNNSDSETTPLNVAANLEISKTVSDATVVPGQPITYTIVYTNNGPQLSTGVVITDIIPAGIENTTFTASPTVTATAGFTYVWQVGTVLAGGEGTIVVEGTVDASIAADTTITNTATINGNFDSTPSSDSATTNVVLPRVSFAAANVDFTEDAANATITVTLDIANPYRATSITYTTSDGTATDGEDYTSGSGVVVFNAGETEATFTVAILEDNIDEADETINLTLSEPDGVLLGTQSTSTVTILDDDAAPEITLSASTYTADEGDGTAPITVTLSNPSAFPVTVDVASTDGTATAGDDYTAVNETVTFDPGDTSATFDVAILEDTTDEADEDLTLTLSAPVSGTLGTPDTATLTITDNDDAPSIAFDSSDYSAGEGDGTATITVTLSNPSDFTVNVDYATGDGTATEGDDYTAATGTLTFTAGVTSTTFDVSILEDTTDEADETVIMTLTNAISGTVGTPNPATLTIIDNDGEPTINFPTPTYEVDESDSTATITVTLSNPSDFPVTVDYETGNGTATAGDDYVAASGTITFTPGVTSTTFSVDIINDTLDETDETVLLTLTNPSAFVLGAGDTATLTILDDDAAPTVSVDSVSANEGNSGNTPFEFEVSISAASGLPVTVQYATANGTATAGSDYTAANGTVTIAAGDTTATVTVNVIGDITLEDDETFSLNLSAPTNATIGNGEGIGTILNDDAATAVTLGSLSAETNRTLPIALLPLGIIAAWWAWRRRK